MIEPEDAGKIVTFPLVAGKPAVEFRFTVVTAYALEERAGCAPWMLSLRGQTVKALVMMLTYALQHADPSMNEARARKLLQRYLDAGGKVKPLSEALAEALRVSGVYGESEMAGGPSDDETGETQPDPGGDEPVPARAVPMGDPTEAVLTEADGSVPLAGGSRG